MHNMHRPIGAIWTFQSQDTSHLPKDANFAVPIGATPNRYRNREDPHSILCCCRVDISRELQIGLLFECSLSAINRTSTTLGLNKRRRQSVGQKNGRKEESNVSCLETSHRFVVLVSEEEVRDIKQQFRHHNTILLKLSKHRFSFQEKV
ncbi:hypothetical protein RvY_14583 [Ramazzottius varieornatus]|uniref:Uncharacterized protein n=1 Tax=Ramazzottius varieornatus TaxID=947166 RepID=A0A1D1VRX3_RAMVA|nr:hypothetical protein RvY_14583 [Ramazzottius varieornatus]